MERLKVTGVLRASRLLDPAPRTAHMLKIAPGTHARLAGEPEVLRLEGKVVGIWVAELRRACEAILRRPGGRVTLDLTDVTFVDLEGLELLREFSARRVTLVNCSPFTAELLKPEGPA